MPSEKIVNFCNWNQRVMGYSDQNLTVRWTLQPPMGLRSGWSHIGKRRTMLLNCDAYVNGNKLLFLLMIINFLFNVQERYVASLMPLQRSISPWKVNYL